jgi:hypothetical protein
MEERTSSVLLRVVARDQLRAWSVEVERYITCDAFPRNGLSGSGAQSPGYMRNIAGCAGGCNASVRNYPGLAIITFLGLLSFVIMVGKETG